MTRTMVRDLVVMAVCTAVIALLIVVGRPA